MIGLLAAFGTTLAWSFSIFSFTEGSRRIGANPVNHFRLVIATVLLTLLAVTAGGLSFGGLTGAPSGDHWLWLGLSGIVGLALGDHFNFTSFAILGARLSSVFTSFAPAVALAAGYFMLGETINAVGIAGIAITCSGVAWLTLNKPSRDEGFAEEHGRFLPGILYALGGAFCQGFGLVLAKKGLTAPGIGIGTIHATWIRMLVGTASIFLVTVIAGRLRAVLQPVLGNNRGGSWFAVAGAVFGPVIGVTLSIYAISQLRVSVAQTIFSLLPVTVMPIAYFYYREKITVKALLGAVMAIAGVIVLVWRDDIAEMAAAWF